MKKNSFLSDVPLFAKILIPMLAVAAVVLIILIAGGGKKGKSSVAESSGAQNAESETAQDNSNPAEASQQESTGAEAETQPGTAQAEVQTEDGSTQVVTVTAMDRPSFLKLLAQYTSPAASVPAYTVDADLGNIVNKEDFYLNAKQTQLLAENGFYIRIGESANEFFEVYEMNRYSLTPNFVTTDSMMHTYHLYFSYLLKNTERDYLTDRLNVLSKQMAEKSLAQYEQLKGTEWETSAKINTAFFAVGASLIDPDYTVPSEVSDLVASELGLIEAAQGISFSPIFNFYEPEIEQMEDYSQYIPRGYYDTSEGLKRYFRTMMWYGRMNFSQSDDTLDRSALLITLALDADTQPAWESIYAVTSFFAGASDDNGYYEYRPVIDAVYGENATVADLPGNTEAWTTYHLLTSTMAPPQINSVVTYDDGELNTTTEKNTGFRFMGQRFSIDAAIFQNLIYDRIGENASGEKRMLPNALDVPAALGSDSALNILDAKGETGYSGYRENMEKLRENILESPEALWSASLYSKWLDTLRPLLEVKGEGYPQFMQNDAWTRKNLQTFLGSYAELKHDTVLYSKQVMAEMGGDAYDVKDDRGYVEPEPVLFARLAALTRATSEGLASYGILSQADADNLSLLVSLSEQLGTIAEKELRNELPTEEEFELIRSFGGQIEHFWQEVCKEEAETTYFASKEFPAAVITDVATDPNGSVLEIGTGSVGKIFVIVPVDGTLRIATGAVYSFYQFDQPLSDRLTDSAWRQMQGLAMNADGRYNSENRKDVEDWTRDFQYYMDELY